MYFWGYKFILHGLEWIEVRLKIVAEFTIRWVNKHRFVAKTQKRKDDSGQLDDNELGCSQKTRLKVYLISTNCEYFFYFFFHLSSISKSKVYYLFLPTSAHNSQWTKKRQHDLITWLWLSILYKVAAVFNCTLIWNWWEWIIN